MKHDRAPRLGDLAQTLIYMLVAVLFSLLLCEPLSRSNHSFRIVVLLRNQISETISDPELQWLVALLLIVLYLLSALPEILQFRNSEKSIVSQSLVPGTSSLGISNTKVSTDYTAHCILTFILIVSVFYIIRYKQDSSSNNVIVLLSSVNIGALAGIVVRGFPRSINTIKGDPDLSVESRFATRFTLPKTRGNRLKLFVLLIPLILAYLTIASGEESNFQYFGNVRWVGLWYNPNLYGSLMAVGLILGVGYVAFDTTRTSLSQMSRFLCTMSSFFCFLGLLFSYSRGAWLGSILGLSYVCLSKLVLMAATSGRDSNKARISKRIIRIAPYCVLLFLALVIIGFWHFRFTEFPLVRRVFSIANPLDFSWRNRIYTWVGAIEMIANRPMTGFGWVSSEQIFFDDFNNWELSDASAFRLNDFLCLGASYGLPVVFFFAVSIVLVIRKPCADILKAANAVGAQDRCNFKFISDHNICNSEIRIIDSCSNSDEFGMVCTIIGALIHLVVVFWFEGCFFVVPTAALFWLLIFIVRNFNLRLVFSEPALETGLKLRKISTNRGFGWFSRFFCSIVAGYALIITVI